MSKKYSGADPSSVVDATVDYASLDLVQHQHCSMDETAEKGFATACSVGRVVTNSSSINVFDTNEIDNYMIDSEKLNAEFSANKKTQNSKSKMTQFKSSSGASKVSGRLMKSIKPDDTVESDKVAIASYGNSGLPHEVSASPRSKLGTSASSFCVKTFNSKKARSIVAAFVGAASLLPINVFAVDTALVGNKSYWGVVGGTGANVGDLTNAGEVDAGWKGPILAAGAAQIVTDAAGKTTFAINKQTYAIFGAVNKDMTAYLFQREIDGSARDFVESDRGVYLGQLNDAGGGNPDMTELYGTVTINGSSNVSGDLSFVFVPKSTGSDKGVHINLAAGQFSDGVVVGFDNDNNPHHVVTLIGIKNVQHALADYSLNNGIQLNFLRAIVSDALRNTAVVRSESLSANASLSFSLTKAADSISSFGDKCGVLDIEVVNSAPAANFTNIINFKSEDVVNGCLIARKITLKNINSNSPDAAKLTINSKAGGNSIHQVGEIIVDHTVGSQAHAIAQSPAIVLGPVGSNNNSVTFKVYGDIKKGLRDNAKDIRVDIAFGADDAKLVDHLVELGRIDGVTAVREGAIGILDVGKLAPTKGFKLTSLGDYKVLDITEFRVGFPADSGQSSKVYFGADNATHGGPGARKLQIGNMNIDVAVNENYSAEFKSLCQSTSVGTKANLTIGGGRIIRSNQNKALSVVISASDDITIGTDLANSLTLSNNVDSAAATLQTDVASVRGKIDVLSITSVSAGAGSVSFTFRAPKEISIQDSKFHLTKNNDASALNLSVETTEVAGSILIKNTSIAREEGAAAQNAMSAATFKAKGGSITFDNVEYFADGAGNSRSIIIGDGGADKSNEVIIQDSRFVIAQGATAGPATLNSALFQATQKIALIRSALENTYDHVNNKIGIKALSDGCLLKLDDVTFDAPAANPLVNLDLNNHDVTLDILDMNIANQNSCQFVNWGPNNKITVKNLRISGPHSIIGIGELDLAGTNRSVAIDLDPGGIVNFEYGVGESNTATGGNVTFAGVGSIVGNEGFGVPVEITFGNAAQSLRTIRFLAKNNKGVSSNLVFENVEGFYVPSTEYIKFESDGGSADCSFSFANTLNPNQNVDFGGRGVLINNPGNKVILQLTSTDPDAGFSHQCSPAIEGFFKITDGSTLELKLLGQQSINFLAAANKIGALFAAEGAPSNNRKVKIIADATVFCDNDATVGDTVFAANGVKVDFQSYGDKGELRLQKYSNVILGDVQLGNFSQFVVAGTAFSDSDSLTSIEKVSFSSDRGNYSQIYFTQPARANRVNNLIISDADWTNALSLNSSPEIIVQSTALAQDVCIKLNGRAAGLDDLTKRLSIIGFNGLPGNKILTIDSDQALKLNKLLFDTRGILGTARVVVPANVQNVEIENISVRSADIAKGVDFSFNNLSTTVNKIDVASVSSVSPVSLTFEGATAKAHIKETQTKGDTCLVINSKHEGQEIRVGSVGKNSTLDSCAFDPAAANSSFVLHNVIIFADRTGAIQNLGSAANQTVRFTGNFQDDGLSSIVGGQNVATISFEIDDADSTWSRTQNQRVLGGTGGNLDKLNLTIQTRKIFSANFSLQNNYMEIGGTSNFKVLGNTGKILITNTQQVEHKLNGFTFSSENDLSNKLFTGNDNSKITSSGEIRVVDANLETCGLNAADNITIEAAKINTKFIVNGLESTKGERITVKGTNNLSSIFQVNLRRDYNIKHNEVVIGEGGTLLIKHNGLADNTLTFDPHTSRVFKMSGASMELQGVVNKSVAIVAAPDIKLEVDIAKLAVQTGILKFTSGANAKGSVSIGQLAMADQSSLEFGDMIAKVNGANCHKNAKIIINNSELQIKDFNSGQIIVGGQKSTLKMDGRFAGSVTSQGAFAQGSEMSLLLGEISGAGVINPLAFEKVIVSAREIKGTEILFSTLGNQEYEFIDDSVNLTDVKISGVQSKDCRMLFRGSARISYTQVSNPFSIYLNGGADKQFSIIASTETGPIQTIASKGARIVIGATEARLTKVNNVSSSNNGEIVVTNSQIDNVTGAGSVVRINNSKINRIGTQQGSLKLAVIDAGVLDSLTSCYVENGLEIGAGASLQVRANSVIAGLNQVTGDGKLVIVNPTGNSVAHNIDFDLGAADKPIAIVMQSAINLTLGNGNRKQYIDTISFGDGSAVAVANLGGKDLRINKFGSADCVVAKLTVVDSVLSFTEAYVDQIEIGRGVDSNFIGGRVTSAKLLQDAKAILALDESGPKLNGLSYKFGQGNGLTGLNSSTLIIKAQGSTGASVDLKQYAIDTDGSVSIESDNRELVFAISETRASGGLKSDNPVRIVGDSDLGKLSGQGPVKVEKGKLTASSWNNQLNIQIGNGAQISANKQILNSSISVSAATLIQNGDKFIICADGTTLEPGKSVPTAVKAGQFKVTEDGRALLYEVTAEDKKKAEDAASNMIEELVSRTLTGESVILSRSKTDIVGGRMAEITAQYLGGAIETDAEFQRTTQRVIDDVSKIVASNEQNLYSSVQSTRMAVVSGTIFADQMSSTAVAPVFVGGGGMGAKYKQSGDADLKRIGAWSAGSFGNFTKDKSTNSAALSGDTTLFACGFGGALIDGLSANASYFYATQKIKDSKGDYKNDATIHNISGNTKYSFANGLNISVAGSIGSAAVSMTTKGSFDNKGFVESATHSDKIYSITLGTGYSYRNAAGVAIDASVGLRGRRIAVPDYATKVEGLSGLEHFYKAYNIDSGEIVLGANVSKEFETSSGSGFTIAPYCGVNASVKVAGGTPKLAYSIGGENGTMVAMVLQEDSQNVTSLSAGLKLKKGNTSFGFSGTYGMSGKAHNKTITVSGAIEM